MLVFNKRLYFLTNLLEIISYFFFIFYWHYRQTFMKQWWPRFFVMYLETSGLGAFNVGPALHFLIDICLNNCIKMMLQENHSIWSHQQLNCLFNSLFMPAVKKTVELHITGPLQGEPPWLADTPQQQCHYNDVIMSAMASQITSFVIVCSTVYLGADWWIPPTK